MLFPAGREEGPPARPEKGGEEGEKARRGQKGPGRPAERDLYRPAGLLCPPSVGGNAGLRGAGRRLYSGLPVHQDGPHARDGPGHGPGVHHHPRGL